MDFSIELAQDFIKSGDYFPVAFDKAWAWLGYSRKDSAKRALLTAGFVENEDFHIGVEPTTTGIAAVVAENIFLSVECFKMWAMMAGTEQGRQIRLYFLECEKIAKAITPTTPALPQTYVEALKALVQAEEEKERLALENSLQAAQIDELEEDVDRLSEITDELFDYSSIVRIAKLNDVNEKTYNWRKLKAASKIKGVEVKHAACPRYGVKNLYHSDAWKLAYPDAKLPVNSALATL